MTEIDTAAIRGRRYGDLGDTTRTIAILCDALDAARVDKGIWRRHTEELAARTEAAEAGEMDYARRIWALERRAMAAEASAEGRHLDRMHERERANAAEARIRAALERHRDPYLGECGDRGCCSEPVTECDTCDQEWPCDTYRVLTGETP